MFAASLFPTITTTLSTKIEHFSLAREQAMSSQCFVPNGTQLAPRFMPCNGTAVANGQHSACCSVNDLCLTNGLCRNPNDNEKRQNFYWRDGCTDPTFEDDACPKYCIGNPSNKSTSVIVFNCLSPETKWVCPPADVKIDSDIKTDGCDVPALTFSVVSPLIYTTVKLADISTMSSPSLTQTDTHSFPTSASNAPTSSNGRPAKSDSSSSGLRIGLGVGISLGVVLFVAIGVFTIMLRRRKTSHTQERKTKIGDGNAQEMGSSALFELYTSSDMQRARNIAPYEAEAERRPAELPTSLGR